MSPKFEYMLSDAGLVSQFRAMQRNYVFYDAKLEVVSSALSPFFQRMCNSGIGDVLARLEWVPEGTDLIMTLFWQWCNKLNLPQTKMIERLLNTMMLGYPDSPFRQCNHLFVWGDRNSVDPMNLEKDYIIYESFSCRPALKSGIKDRKITATLFVTTAKTKDTRLKVYAGGIESVGRKVKPKFHASFNDAVEYTYQEYYALLTRAKFFDAKLANVGKDAIIYGNWIGTDSKLSDIKKNAKATFISDKKDNQIFVVGLPRLQKDSIISKIKAINHGGRTFYVSDFTATVEFENGITLNQSLDWKVHKPEQYVEGEVFCDNCKQLFGDLTTCDMKEVKTIGPICGPCIDKIMETTDIEGLFE